MTRSDSGTDLSNTALGSRRLIFPIVQSRIAVTSVAPVSRTFPERPVLLHNAQVVSSPKQQAAV
jgi:hypothetical protein